MIAEYANLPLIPPFLEPGNSQKKLYGVNFASAGAGALVETFQGSVRYLSFTLFCFNFFGFFFLVIVLHYSVS